MKKFTAAVLTVVFLAGVATSFSVYAKSDWYNESTVFQVDMDDCDPDEDPDCEDL